MVIKVLSRVVTFEWDKGNIDKNLKKHNVSNQEAEEIFSNKPVVFSEDKKHLTVEKRYMLLGKTNKKRLLTIFFTIRINRIRIISARDMHKRERGEYEKT
jgi:uncharacterized DUF497 family protein